MRVGRDPARGREVDLQAAVLLELEERPRRVP